MAYRFKLSETFDRGVRRIGLQQIDRAVAELEALADPAAAVHGTRKCLKRLRALLRLARPGLDEALYQAENQALRDIGRLLAGARDRQVLVDTAEKLGGVATGKTQAAFKAARAALGAHATSNGHDNAPVETRAIERALAELRDARQRMEKLKFSAKSYDVALDGLKRSYKQAVRAFEQIGDGTDVEASHEWRKRVQHHWRHMMLMSDAWPALFQARISAARELSAVLGQEHDIDLLRAEMGEGALAGLPADQRKAIDTFATARQAALRLEAEKLGFLIFAERPGSFRKRMARYWAAAQDVEAKAHSV